ncbi:MAG: hypothetical protein QXG44_10415 [Candidatus Jordarchaeaceae archaeon]
MQGEFQAWLYLSILVAEELFLQGNMSVRGLSGVTLSILVTVELFYVDKIKRRWNL